MKPISQALFLIAFLFIPAIVLSQPPARAYGDGIAVVDYDSPLPSGNAERLHRQRANSRYDKQAWVVSVTDKEVGGVGRVDEAPPALNIPSDESSLIATGLITNSTAYLSNDKGGVYTEFTFRISKVIKNDSANNVVPGASVVADRAGGAIRYTNGHKLIYHDSDHGLPYIAETYLLFLKREGESPNYRILNGYQIDGSRIVRGLEREWNPEFKTMSASELIAAIRREMANPVYRRIDVERADDCPVRIESVTTGYGPVAIGQKFPAGTDWLKQLTVTVSNASNRKINYIEGAITFPRRPANSDKPDYAFPRSYGLPPGTRTQGFALPPVAPGGRVTLEVDDFNYRVLVSDLHQNGYTDGAREARVQITSVTFSDGSVWRRIVYRGER